MHLLITDSGVGGLSVCAFAERFLRSHGVKEPVKLTYVNASPENDFGYNSMASRREKIENFDRFLGIVDTTYSPDQIYIACNTLSVIFHETDFSNRSDLSVEGIVETGVKRILQKLEHSARMNVVVFGTDTTIEENTYARLLEHNGIARESIISQACPSLADTISEDRQGLSAQRKIEKYVKEAIEKSTDKEADYLVYLACTHYGYRKDYFGQAFRGTGHAIDVLNPNEFVAEEILTGIISESTENRVESAVDVEFVSRYQIPETALETITFFLEEISPETVRAFTHYTHAPDLF